MDDFSRKIFVYFLQTKDEVPAVTEKFINSVQNQSGYKIKILRTNNGREYVNSNHKNILDRNGTKHETSVAYNPQQNGRAERINRALMDKARCMLAYSKLDVKFWAEAISTAAYLVNRSPKKNSSMEDTRRNMERPATRLVKPQDIWM